MQSEIEKTVSPTVDPNQDFEAGQLKAVPAEQGEEYAGTSSGDPKGQLRRKFKTRHVQMIALGANIGSGVYVSSGKVG
jgi:amino acid transporter